MEKAWREKFGCPCGAADIDAMYADFLPMQKSVLLEHSQVIAGVADAVAACRQRGLKIGSSTGYTRELMEIVSRAAREQGYEPNCVLCAEDAPRGRPAPYLLYEAAMRLSVYPTWTMVNVDDTPVGIQAGRNAGCWCVGITRTGNGVGLSAEEAAKLSQAELRQSCDAAGDQLKAAGAHFLLESVAEIPALLTEIEQRAARGELPLP
ncbi:MAG: HAD hydrolase-like protein [Planctomycetaceae bacterium]